MVSAFRKVRAVFRVKDNGNYQQQQLRTGLHEADFSTSRWLIVLWNCNVAGWKHQATAVSHIAGKWESFQSRGPANG